MAPNHLTGDGKGLEDVLASIFDKTVPPQLAASRKHRDETIPARLTKALENMKFDDKSLGFGSPSRFNRQPSLAQQDLKAMGIEFEEAETEAEAEGHAAEEKTQ